MGHRAPEEWRESFRDFRGLREVQRCQDAERPVRTAVGHQAAETGVAVFCSTLRDSGASGSSIATSNPGFAFRAVSLPLCNSTDRRAMASPTPPPPLPLLRSESTR